MATPVISGDGIFSHVFIGASDVVKSEVFYDAVLDSLGIKTSGHLQMTGCYMVAKSRLSLSHVPATAKYPQVMV